jgi:hypothetical protein
MLKLKIAVLVVLCGFIILSCAQDSIFFYISNEPEPKDPIVAGSVTNIVVAHNRAYAGTRMSKKIYHFTEADKWKSVKIQGGSLGDLASDGTDLYVLHYPGGNPLKSSFVKKYDPVTNAEQPWTDILSETGSSIQTLYGAGGFIFAGAQNTSNRTSYAILKYNPNDPTIPNPGFVQLVSNTSLLSGATEITKDGDIFLSTAGSGVYEYDRTTVKPEVVISGYITGIIATGEVITAVSSGGTVFRYDPSQAEPLSSFSKSVNFTGAMAVWNQYNPDSTPEWKPALLLLGVRGSSYSHGYRELVLENEKPTDAFYTPGTHTVTSVKSKSKYDASIGKHPVQFILQLPKDVFANNVYRDPADPDNEGWEPLIFASTSRNGLWSYRNGTWNAED